nr:uncharacterized protein LOC117853497 [Setaria viridis]
MAIPVICVFGVPRHGLVPFSSFLRIWLLLLCVAFLLEGLSVMFVFELCDSDYYGNKEDQLPLHIDMVLVDDKENRMYAEIPGPEADQFKKLIREGWVYVFRKFVVSACKPAYKPFESTQMIRFTPWTTVEEKAEMADKLPKLCGVFHAHRTIFSDTIEMIVGVSEVAYVQLPSNQSSTAKRVISLKDLRNNQINLVLWGSRATDFDAEGVHSVGQESPVVAIFVGMLLKSYKGSACKWYINEEIPEIEKFFDRMLDTHSKIEWISAGEQQFRALEQQKNLEEKTVLQLRDMDPWEFEGSGYRCTVTISRINNKQLWYRLSLIGTDGTATAEFILFGRVARQIIGKPVVSLVRSASKNQHGSSGTEFEHMLPELAGLVSQKFTFSVSITQKSLI